MSRTVTEHADVLVVGAQPGPDRSVTTGGKRLTDTAVQDRAVGVRRRRVPRPSRRIGWAALTPSELKVAALVAQGLTNPQIAVRLFLSRSTVQTHLEHVFAKLDISSRVVLAAEIARRSA
jgi:DNA-binding CsgD family transcriptional regulator